MNVVQFIKNNKLSLCLGLIWAIGLIILTFYVTQSSFKFILTGYVLAFVAYTLVLWRAHHHILPSVTTWKFYLVLGIVVRIILLFAFPALSDDFYRFIWDGRLITQGIHPLSHLPSQIIGSNMHLEGLDETLFAALNSPDYYTIYPPFSQLIFALSTIIVPQTIFSSMFFMKLFLLIGEGVGLYYFLRILSHLELPSYYALFYVLNPLVVIEIIGNMHFEGWMIAWLLMSIYLLLKQRYTGSGIVMGLAVGAKLLPLMFVPLWLLYMGNKKNMSVWLLGLTISLAIQFVPYFYTLEVSNFLSSFQLYFQKFEFNAGIYYAMRALGRWMVGYNLIHFIGPALALFALAIILVKSWQIRDRRSPMVLLDSMFMIYLTYVLLATTIHPWYIIMLVALGTFRMKWSVLLWSFLITLTYVNYSSDPYAENLWVVAFEYSLLFMALGYEHLNPFILSKKTR